MGYNSEEDIRKMEPILLQRYIEELRLKDVINGRPLSPANIIASALTQLTSLYNQAIKRERGPGWWVCGTHLNNQRKHLSCIIGSRYSDEQLNKFIEFCCCKNIDQSCPSFSDDERENHMVKDFLTLRPEPCVHPPLSYWRTLIDE